ncbi:hypothetical protein B4067_2261 [Bacillus subtilis subsp. subtilis]|uniref:Secreted protein n=1 Tax=Bacillus subtilis subsp. subtilis TaxID=135461 RepID=A0ABD3ZUP4_BACIU|nr:hypothetical protein B4067_2261 [Bacillus subtilis subsp. subtilis]
MAAIGRKLPAKNALVEIATFFRLLIATLEALTTRVQIAVLAEAVVAPIPTALKFKTRFFRVDIADIPVEIVAVRRDVLKSRIAVVAEPKT